MTPTFDIFTFTPFPVFVTDSAGNVILKNDPCRQYLKKIRKGINASKHFKDKDIFLQQEKIAFSEVPCDGPFSRFAVSKIRSDAHEEYFVFMFLPMLQLANHVEIERFITDRSNEDIFDFYIDIKNASGYRRPDRLYAETVAFVNKYDVDISSEERSVDTAYLLDKLFSSLSGAFTALGVRISSRIDKNIYYNRFCRC